MSLSTYLEIWVTNRKLGIANLVLERYLTINMTTDENLEKVIKILIMNALIMNAGNIADKDVDYEPPIENKLKGNNNVSETETYLKLEADTEVQNNNKTS